MKMKMKIAILVLFFFSVGTSHIFSQIYVQPNYALKSHETLEISKVDVTSEKTVLYMSVENRIQGGNFCADRNIYIIGPEGEKLKLIKASGIPVCPDNYKFINIGEVLKFTLEFPPLNTGIKWIDIVEECANNCFWIYGITLDNDLNKRLNDIFTRASKGKPAENIVLFKTLLDSIGNKNLGIEGSLYINIINAATEDADNLNRIVWYKRLTTSHVPRLSQYIKYLNDKGIKY
jgi:hypothetical protein